MDESTALNQSDFVAINHPTNLSNCNETGTTRMEVPSVQHHNNS